MSLAHKTAGSLLWATAASAGARVVTIGSTFLLTRYLTPAVQGEVNLAYVLVTTAGMATALGASQFVAAHPKEGRDTAFHASLLVLGAGLVACLGCCLAAEPTARALHVEGMARHVPGLALAHYLDRATWLPRAILVREMRFRTLGLRVAAGELTFAVASVALAAMGLRGDAIVGGNLARSAIGVVFMLAVTDVRDYLYPHRPRLATFRRILSFGLPLTVSQIFRLGATTWDNSLMGYRFGGSVVGIYNQAYRLAELPATALGDPCNDVLVPTFARLSDPAQRRAAFLRATALLGLVVFPMACGLGAIAPSLVEVFYPKAYAAVAPFLAALAVIGVVRALTSLSGAYLQVAGRTRSFVGIDACLVVTVLGSMSALSRWGPLAASLGVGVGFVASLSLTLRALRPEGIAIAAVLRSIARPLGVCAPMIAAVIAMRAGLRSISIPPAARLACEIATGGLVYALAARSFAPLLVRDFLSLAGALIRRRAPTRAPEEGSPRAQPQPGTRARTR